MVWAKDPKTNQKLIMREDEANRLGWIVLEEVK